MFSKCLIFINLLYPEIFNIDLFCNASFISDIFSKIPLPMITVITSNLTSSSVTLLLAI